MLNGSATDYCEGGDSVLPLTKKNINKFFGMTYAMEEYVIRNVGCQGSLQGKFLEVRSKKINKIQHLIQIIQLKTPNHSKNPVSMQSFTIPFLNRKILSSNQSTHNG